MIPTDLLRGAIDMILGGVGALIGAFLLWKVYALPKINSWVVEQGAAKLKDWITDVVEHPDKDNGQQIGKLAGVAFAYIMQGIMEDLSSKEGRERWKPIFDSVSQHIQQSIFATYGHLLKKISEDGGESGLPGAFNVPPFIAGLATKFAPGIDPAQLIQVAGWLSRMSGREVGLPSSNPLPGSPLGGGRGGGVL